MVATRERPIDRGGRSADPALRRTTDDRVIWGVAGGVAEQLRLDAIAVRIVFVALTAVWGAGVFLYVVARLAIAEVDSPSTNPVKPAMRPMWGQGVALLLVCAGLIATARAFGTTPPDDVLIPWLMVVVGSALVWGRQPLRPRRRLALPPAPADRDPSPTDGFDPPRLAPEPEPIPGPAPIPEPAPAPSQSFAEPPRPAPRADRERSRRVPLGTLTAGALLVTSGMLYLLERGGMVEISWRLLGSLGAVIIGGALIAGGWWGRPRGLITVGIGLCAALLIATIVQVPFTGGVGRRHLVVEPDSVLVGTQEHRLGVGTMTLDLTDINPIDVQLASSGWPTDEPGPVIHIIGSLGAGQMRVVVRPDQAVVVDARVGLGSYDLLGTGDNGVAIEQIVAIEPVDGLGPPLVLDLDVGVGSITVEVVESREAGVSGD
ncbi:MAG: PspC domain-containing protein [Actinomycetia bacterium]|nr:PspC domain-containing protein [Actinomycetes bacterium]